MHICKLFQVTIALFLISNIGNNLNAESYSLLSPDNTIEVKVGVTDKISYSILRNSSEIIRPSSISMTLDNGAVLGGKPKVANVERRSENKILTPAVRQKRKEIADTFNEIAITMENNYGLIFRAYNDGIAYRFFTEFEKDITVFSEEAQIALAENNFIYFPEEESFISHFEREYTYVKAADIPREKFCSLPALVETGGGSKVLITEADLEDYPGMFLQGTGSAALTGIFPRVILKAVPDPAQPDRNEKVERRADYIAKTSGTRAFPWRVFVISANDGQLVDNEMVYKLAQPSRLENTSWIKPGKVAWDWWNANNVYGVDFRAGINTETYKYYIDFAARYNIDYIVLDEGWTETTDVLKPIPEIDMAKLTGYAKKKNVGIILWVLWKPLDNQLQKALDRYKEWGIKGIKVDFMQRDDQEMVNYYWRVAREAAKRELLVDYHGAYKPSGLHRTYPNVITREGLKGLENSKWSALITPEHDVTLPFIRMASGPMDFTPGAMINAQKENFRAVFERPMSMGTRCHQLAMYVVYESPLQMLCDSPSNYYKEPECMDFLSRVPTVWDETKVLDAKVADYVVIARKSGTDWYVGAMTDGEPREFTIDFSFLQVGDFTMNAYMDGINADRYGSDYKKIQRSISSGDKLNIKLAPGGGWVARIKEDK